MSPLAPASSPGLSGYFGYAFNAQSVGAGLSATFVLPFNMSTFTYCRLLGKVTDSGAVGDFSALNFQMFEGDNATVFPISDASEYDIGPSGTAPTSWGRVFRVRGVQQARIAVVNGAGVARTFTVTYFVV